MVTELGTILSCIHLNCFVGEKCTKHILRWNGHDDTIGVPIELIRDLKIEYENKLKILKEDIQSKRNWEYQQFLQNCSENT